MTSGTDELRRMLDERGVEWGASDTYRLLVTSWSDASGHSWSFMEHRDGSFNKLTAYHLTPKQAIAATLGRGTCKLTMDGTDGCFGCSECLENIPPLANYCPNCGRRCVG